MVELGNLGATPVGATRLGDVYKPRAAFRWASWQETERVPFFQPIASSLEHVTAPALASASLGTEVGSEERWSERSPLSREGSSRTVVTARLLGEQWGRPTRHEKDTKKMLRDCSALYQ